MRLPWVQVDQSAFARASELAAILGISTPEALGHLVMVWRWALDLGPEDQPPLGVAEGRVAVVRLEAGAEWRGERGVLFSALVDLGLVEGDPESLRVRGLDRYQAVVSKRAADRARKAAVRNGSSEGSRAEVARTSKGRREESRGKTQTQTQKKQTSSVGDGSPAALVLVGEEPRPERKQSLQQRFWVWAQEQRRIEGLLPDPEWPIPKLNKRLESIREHPNQLVAEAYLEFLGDERHRDKGWPMAFFAADWPRYAQQVRVAAEGGAP